MVFELQSAELITLRNKLVASQQMGAGYKDRVVALLRRIAELEAN